MAGRSDLDSPAHGHALPIKRWVMSPESNTMDSHAVGQSPGAAVSSLHRFPPSLGGGGGGSMHGNVESGLQFDMELPKPAGSFSSGGHCNTTSNDLLSSSSLSSYMLPQSRDTTQPPSPMSTCDTDFPEDDDLSHTGSSVPTLMFGASMHTTKTAPIRLSGKPSSVELSTSPHFGLSTSVSSSSRDDFPQPSQGRPRPAPLLSPSHFTQQSGLLDHELHKRADITRHAPVVARHFLDMNAFKSDSSTGTTTEQAGSSSRHNGAKHKRRHPSAQSPCPLSSATSRLTVSSPVKRVRGHSRSVDLTDAMDAPDSRMTPQTPPATLSGSSPVTPSWMPDPAGFAAPQLKRKSFPSRKCASAGNTPVRRRCPDTPFRKRASPQVLADRTLFHFSHSVPKSFSYVDQEVKRESSYEWISVVGEGSFGVVSKCRHRSTNTIVAVKKSKKPLASTLEVEELKEQIKLVCSLHSPHTHPNIVRYTECWKEKGHSFIETDLCELGNLEEYLVSHFSNNAPGDLINEGVVWHFLMQMGSALKRCTAKGIVHMDVKPDNIYVTAGHSFKLGDFGIAFAMNTQATHGDGDNRYMAPEVLKSGAGPASDVFSLGISAYELVMGLELPSQGQDWTRLREGDLDFTNPVFPVSDELKDLIKAMMHPDPQQRASASTVTRTAAKHCTSSLTPAIRSPPSALPTPTSSQSPSAEDSVDEPMKAVSSSGGGSSSSNAYSVWVPADRAWSSSSASPSSHTPQAPRVPTKTRGRSASNPALRVGRRIAFQNFAQQPAQGHGSGGSAYTGVKSPASSSSSSSQSPALPPLAAARVGGTYGAVRHSSWRAHPLTQSSSPPQRNTGDAAHGGSGGGFRQLNFGGDTDMASSQ